MACIFIQYILQIFNILINFLRTSYISLETPFPSTSFHVPLPSWFKTFSFYIHVHMCMFVCVHKETWFNLSLHVCTVVQGCWIRPREPMSSTKCLLCLEVEILLDHVLLLPGSIITPYNVAWRKLYILHIYPHMYIYICIYIF